MSTSQKIRSLGAQLLFEIGPFIKRDETERQRFAAEESRTARLLALILSVLEQQASDDVKLEEVREVCEEMLLFYNSGIELCHEFSARG